MKSFIFNVSLIVIIVFFMLLCNNLLLRNQLEECNNKEVINNLESDSNHVSDSLNDEIINKEYNCSFTVTYRVVNLLDGYIAEVPEYSYVVVDKFQEHGAIAHFIPTELKNNLEINHSYEFTYHIKGNGIIDDIYDVINNISLNHYDNGNLSVVLSIKETDKLGLEQIQENICS